MKNKKKQFAAILLAASMLFINTNTSLYAKEEPKAKPEAAQEMCIRDSVWSDVTGSMIVRVRDETLHLWDGGVYDNMG